MAKKAAPQDEMLVEEPAVHCSGKLTPIADVKPNPANPKVHPDDQVRMLAEVLKVNGWRAPIIVSNRSGMVVKGHGRLQTALHLKLKRVPVERQDYVDEQSEYADMIADNRIGEHGYMDAFKLGGLLKKISGKGQETLGYTQEEIDLYMAAEYVAPEATDRQFVVLETLKMTKAAKAIVMDTFQKYCLRMAKEIELGEALAQICMQWQVGVLPTLAQVAPAQKKPEPKPEQAVGGKKKAVAAPAAPAVAMGPGTAEFEVKYAADTWLGEKKVFIVRAADGARYYTNDEAVMKAGSALKGQRATVEFVMNDGVAWIESLEAA